MGALPFDETAVHRSHGLFTTIEPKTSFRSVHANAQKAARYAQRTAF